MPSARNGIIRLLVAGTVMGGFWVALPGNPAAAPCGSPLSPGFAACKQFEAKANEVKRKILVSQAIERAMDILQCMKETGDQKKCWGYYTLLPPPPPEPYQQKFLATFDPKDRELLREAMRQDAKLRYQQMVQDIEALFPGK